MKIRTGFVSNSSSSSFCLFGVYIKPKDILESKIDELYEENKDKSWCNSKETFIKSLENELPEYTGYEEYGPDPDWMGYPSGAAPGECPDNMTMGEFKETIKKELTEWVGEEKANKACWITEGWYNG